MKRYTKTFDKVLEYGDVVDVKRHKDGSILLSVNGKTAALTIDEAADLRTLLRDAIANEIEEPVQA